jgi:hypothetical protein
LRARTEPKKINQVETLAELEYGVKTNIDVVKTHGQTVGTLSIHWKTPYFIGKSPYFMESLWWVSTFKKARSEIHPPGISLSVTKSHSPHVPARSERCQKIRRLATWNHFQDMGCL